MNNFMKAFVGYWDDISNFFFISKLSLSPNSTDYMDFENGVIVKIYKS